MERARHFSLMVIAAGWLFAGSPGQAQAPPPISPPRSPQEALAAFRVDPGLRVELVAAEPEIQSPVAMAFDEQGRLWVVEMLDYPLGPKPGAPPEGRIKILTDRDGDGRYETSTLFADHLLFANGLQPWKGGAIVTAATEIVELPDGDRDGRADGPKPLFTGFSTQNSQLLVAFPTLGQDGLIYVANGLRSGQIKRAAQGEMKPINISGMDFRFDPNGPLCEAVAGMGQFGLTFDDWGRRFVCDNRHHLRHVVLPNRALGRNPNLAVRQVVRDISEIDDPEAKVGARLYPLSQNWTTSSQHVGRFTAACGVFVYRGGLLPEPYRDAAFTCDPTGNLVHMEVLRPDGASFRSKPARDGVEFLASPDDWFRPVALSHGPDGALYVVDMGRAVIEHPEWMPPELQKRPDLIQGKERGRIWRIVPEKAEARTPAPSLANAPTANLVPLLGHSNAWHRTTAHRLILERNEPAAIALLRAVLDAAESAPIARHLAAQLLANRGELDEPRLLALLRSPSSGVRENAVQLAEPRLPQSEALRDRLVAMAGDPDARVRFEVALALGAWDDRRTVEPLAKIALSGVDDPWTRIAVASSLADRAGLAIAAICRGESASPGGLQMIRELATLVGARRDPDEVLTALETLTRDRVPNRERFGLLGLAEGMSRRGIRLDAFLKSRPADGREAERAARLNEPIAAAFARAAADIERPDLDESTRLGAIRLLGQAPWEQAGPTLGRVLKESPEREVRLEAARALEGQVGPEVGRALMAAWPSATPALRGSILAAMLRRPERAATLLDSIEARDLSPGDLDPASSRQLTEHAVPEIRNRARVLLRGNLPEERKEALARYQAAVDMPGDKKRGREVFRKNCTSCHRVDDIGVAVGPDIGDTRTKTRAMLLNDILNPNAAIDGGSINYSVSLRDGRVLTGLIASESAASLTLIRAEGQTDIVLRQDAEEIRSTGVSLMPEGLERNFSVQEMADLLTFLKDWRYVDQTPVGRGDRPGN
ncbi:PVC-type heme-binding CxxCH protein [Tundrisphaera sp. TA3]|uniref:PVC-type heme-binding CxxCH protein n=1 Tax=Tundrisphaera sp. TA3 TaxID=3435775 RepID=UPI003EBC3FF6